MMELISPKYRMKLVKQVAEAIWAEYSSYKEVEFYIQNWHYLEEDQWGNIQWENFSIKYKDAGGIDLPTTLHLMDGELLLKIAIDIGVDTPDYIPSIPIFRNEIKLTSETALATFERAVKQTETHPDIAIGLANSALESIIKEILKDKRLNVKSKSGDTLYKLTEHILKALKTFPGANVTSEIQQIGNGLMSACQGIENLRSNKTQFHGKTDDDHLIEDSIYAFFIVNSVTTIGLFLSRYYKHHFPKPIKVEDENDELPF
jgi:hypothetical protein